MTENTNYNAAPSTKQNPTPNSKNSNPTGSQPDTGSLKKRSIIKIAAAVIILAVCLIGALTFYQSNYKTATIVGLDANPSLQINANSKDSVLAVTALNTEGGIILGDMELKGTSLEVAVNALIGSMLTHGYITAIDNSVLVSIENADERKTAELEEQLREKINNLLETYSINSALLLQTMTEDAELQKLADAHKISLGKATLVQSIAAQDSTKDFDTLAGLSVNELNLLLSGTKNKTASLITSGEASTSEYIGTSKAQSIALQDAGYKESAVKNLTVEMDYDQGRMIYDVDFDTNDGYEFDYEIDALSGKIIARESDKEGTVEVKADTSYLTETEARNKAIEHAGVKAAQASNVTVEFDYDNGRAVYEIDFDADGKEYDYEIDAITGEVREYDVEKKDNTAATSAPKDTADNTGSTDSSSGSNNTGNDNSASSTESSQSSNIEPESARQIAFNHAGVSSSSATNVYVELDSDDGRAVYEVDFIAGTTEYDYEIDAVSGEIISSDSEPVENDDDDDD